VPKDAKQANRLFRISAENDNSDAQYELGISLQYKFFADHKEAVFWFQKSAAQGNKNAQYSLALCYEHGTGVKKDLSEALSWYRKAAEQNHKQAQARVQVLTV
jgi:TPR repeat protein